MSLPSRINDTSARYARARAAQDILELEGVFAIEDTTDVYAAGDHEELTRQIIEASANNTTNGCVQWMLPDRPKSSFVPAAMLGMTFFAGLGLGSTTCTTMLSVERSASRLQSLGKLESLAALSSVPDPVVGDRPQTIADQIAIGLGKLSDGWAGPGTIAPSTKVLSDVDTVLGNSLPNLLMPDVEVEEDDGSVTLRWLAANQQRSFALVFRGSGSVTGVISSIDPPGANHKAVQVTDQVAIAELFEHAKAKDIAII